MRLIADAKVLSSSVLGGRAGLVLMHPAVEEVLTPEVTFSEVHEYAAILSRARRLSADALLLAVAALPILLVDAKVYERSISQARRLLGCRDPDDVDVLALALHMKLPLWSNDNDFEETGIEWCTTAELLKTLKL